jgi:hypothetical protein
MCIYEQRGLREQWGGAVRYDRLIVSHYQMLVGCARERHVRGTAAAREAVRLNIEKALTDTCYYCRVGHNPALRQPIASSERKEVHG